MTIFYDINKLEKAAGSDPNKFLALLEFHYTKKLPKYKNSKYKPVEIYGGSYLLNPEPLFTNNTVDILYKVQYIKLAARRDYTLYKSYGSKALLLSYLPDINMAVIKHNPLLIITDKTINFKYET